MVENTKSPVLTFVGKSYAKKGFLFFFDQAHPNCPSTCPLFATCQKNLIPNTLYEVREVKNKQFECPSQFHEETMVLVKLGIPEVNVSMHNKDIFEGSLTTFTPVGCDQEDCENIDYCAPQSLVIKAGEKIKILSKIHKIKHCPRNLHLTLVRVEKKTEGTD